MAYAAEKAAEVKMRGKQKNPYYGITIDPKPKTPSIKKKPVFTPTKADGRGFKAGGSIESFQDQVKRKYGGGKL